MGALKPIIEIGSQIAGAVVGAKGLYDAVTAEDPFEDQLAAAESRREELELRRDRREFDEGLRSYLSKLSRSSTNYVATYHDRIAKDYRRRVDDVKERDVSDVPDPSPASMLIDHNAPGTQRS